MSIKNFMVQHSKRDVVNMLTNEDAGILFKAMFDYDVDGVTHDFFENPTLQIAYRSMIADLDIGFKSKQKHSEQQRLKALMARYPENDPVHLDAKQRLQTLKSVPFEEYETVYKSTDNPRIPTDTLNKNKPKEKNVKKEKLIEFGVSQREPPTLDEWEKYAEEIDMPTDIIREYNRLSANGWTDKHGKPIQDWRSYMRKMYSD